MSSPSNNNNNNNNKYPCSGCSAYLLADEFPAHLGICTHQFVPCTLCRNNILRADLRNHMMDDCTLRLVRCDKCSTDYVISRKEEHDNKECRELSNDRKLLDLVKSELKPFMKELITEVRHEISIDTSLFNEDITGFKREVMDQIKVSNKEFLSEIKDLQKESDRVEAYIINFKKDVIEEFKSIRTAVNLCTMAIEEINNPKKRKQTSEADEFCTEADKMMELCSDDDDDDNKSVVYDREAKEHDDIYDTPESSNNPRRVKPKLNSLSATLICPTTPTVATISSASPTVAYPIAFPIAGGQALKPYALAKELNKWMHGKVQGWFEGWSTSRLYETFCEETGLMIPKSKHQSSPNACLTQALSGIKTKDPLKTVPRLPYRIGPNGKLTAR
jgi:hypothetical protein